MTFSNRETEIKLRLAGADQGRELLRAARFAIRRPRALESNELWDTATRDFRRKGEILRLRSYDNQTILTFKGPATMGRHKSREEVEVQMAEVEPARIILRRIGLEPSYRYEKFRTEYHRPGEAGFVTLDETPIGVFLELEGQANWIDSVATELGFHLSDYLLSSYAALYFDFCQEHGMELGAGMVYEGTATKHT
jgi:adenylate cyclase class 2